MPVGGGFTGFGDEPELVSAASLGLRVVRVVFSEALGDTVALGEPASYTLTPQGDAVARTILVAVQDPEDPSAVLLTVDDDLTTGSDTYELEVTGSLVDAAGNPLASPAVVLVDVSPDADGVPDHEALGLRRLIAQYRGQPNIEHIIRELGVRMRGVDQEAVNVAAFRALSTAYGVGLDQLGELLELGREGVSDAAYRLRLRAMALARSSQGHQAQVIAVLVLLLDGPNPTHEEHYPAAVVMEAVDIPNEDGWVFARITRKAVAAGVQFQLLHNEPDVDLFGWDDDPSAGPWAEIDDDPDGGFWAEAS